MDADGRYGVGMRWLVLAPGPSPACIQGRTERMSADGLDGVGMRWLAPAPSPSPASLESLR